MTYSDLTISTQDGQEIGLFEFRLGGIYWRYTSADEDKTFGLDEDGNPAVWTAGAITRTAIQQGGAENDLEITLPRNLEIVSLFSPRPPSEITRLTVSSYHEGDAEAAIQWIGTVGNIIGINPAEAKAVCRNIVASFERGGLRLTWGRQCPHPLYGPGCWLDKADFAYPKEVATVTGNSFTVTVPEVPVEGSFAGGFVEWEREAGTGTYERIGIESVSGDNLILFASSYGLEPGMAVTLYPGCPRTTEGCLLFNNLPNYGGVPHLPGETLFGAKRFFS